MRLPSPLRSLVLATLVLVGVPPAAQAQYFGRNKVQYDDFRFHVLQTEHFDVYYYPEEEQAVGIAARMAERWYSRLSRLLDHEFEDRQPLILYGSHPDFVQTNVISNLLGEEIGGVTESLRRRIVLPFAAGMAETDHVLGHELVHAFQYDIADRHRTTMRIPLWVAEGMAEYLSVGPADPLTAMWLRDAAEAGQIPTIEELEGWRYSPYRYGHALWAFMAARFGDGVLGEVLKAKPVRNVRARLETVTGKDAAALSADWHAAVDEAHASAREALTGREISRPVITRRDGGRLNVGPALSPDGRQIIFLSERDQFSIDLFLADAESGAIVRKLLTTTANPRIESLQVLHSAGAWDPEGQRFALTTIQQGRPVLTIIDVHDGRRLRDIPLPDFGEVFNPTWSPDGGAIAFSALRHGVTDLFVYDIERAAVDRLTDDVFADLQPAWAPDGRTLAFVTDRYTSDLETLAFGGYRLALYHVESGAIEAVPTVDARKTIDPHWAPDGRTLYAVADRGGISNVFRIDLASGAIRQVTDVVTGVSGIGNLSPALTLASSAPRLAFTLYRAGRYEIHTISADEPLAGFEPPPLPHGDAAALPVGTRERASDVAAFLAQPREGLPPRGDFEVSPYAPRLSLDQIGQPYLMSGGGGGFGSYVRGGVSFHMGDMLGDRRLGTAIQVGSRIQDFAAQVRYLDRGSRWNWGLTAEHMPFVRGRLRGQLVDAGAGYAISRELEQQRQIHHRVAGHVAYPFSRAQRLELGSGLRRIGFARQLDTRVVSLNGGDVIDEYTERLPGGHPATLLETSAALVYDAAVWGPTSPIVGRRYRFEVEPAVGSLTYTNVLADYRQYVMPIRPYTLAVRLLHMARYGGHADDPRLIPLYLGHRNLVRGYDSRSWRVASCADLADCSNIDQLFGTRLAVVNLEVRFPLLGPLSRRIQYGALPLEGLVFADAGASWTKRSRADGEAEWREALLRSVGAGVRVNAAGMILELDVVRPLDRARDGWTVSFNFSPGF